MALSVKVSWPKGWGFMEQWISSLQTVRQVPFLESTKTLQSTWAWNNFKRVNVQFLNSNIHSFLKLISLRTLVKTSCLSSFPTFLLQPYFSHFRKKKSYLTFNLGFITPEWKSLRYQTKEILYDKKLNVSNDLETNPFEDVWETKAFGN